MSEFSTFTGESAQLDCPECHTAITYYDVAGSEYYACPNCHAYFKYSGEETTKVMGNYQQAPARPPIIPLGSIGDFKDRRWRMVGVVARCEVRAEQYKWLEFQLFRAETNQYAQLAQYNGHWLFVEASERDFRPKMNGRFTYAPEGTYKLYNRYNSRVEWALGEFDWDIEGDRDLQVSEFIKPPYMLVLEKRGKQSNWYRAEHLEPEEVAAAFGLSPNVLPSPEGVGAAQPDPLDRKGASLRVLTLLAVGLLFIGQLLSNVQHPTQEVLAAHLQVQADSTAAPGTGRVIVSPSFTLAQPSVLDIDLTATLTNQWLELPVSLVNEQTGEGFEFTKNIEFYSGVEGGESWREGDRDANAVLSRVPAGRYHLNFYPFTEAGVRPDLAVKVTANPTLWSNFIICLLLVLSYPAFQLWRSISFETRRWSQSDFGPNN